MPRVVTLIKNCCYFTLIVVLVTIVSSLFVWQADVYQSTIDEQIRLMKLDISAMKKENHLMEIKINEQSGKHDEMKDSFRYLLNLKQAKWPVEGMDEGEEDEEKKKKREVPHYVLNIGNKPDTMKEAAAGGDTEKDEINPLENALKDINMEDTNQEVKEEGKEEEEENHDITDLTKRTHVLIISEKRGGSDVLGKLIAHDENIFYLPSISSVIRTEADFSNIRHCIISDEVVTYYKTHQAVLMSSKSLAKFCPEGKCQGFTAGALENECVKKHMSVLEGHAEDWDLKMVDRISVEVAYVSRDPRAIISELMDLGDVTEESVQEFSKQLCARIAGFLQYQPSSHYLYQVVKYEKLASSPVTALSEIYHKLFETTLIPTLNLTKDYKNQLFLSISDWKQKLSQIAVDAVEEECPGVS